MSEQLRRKILKGEQYEKLLPKVQCEMHFCGKGNTDFSISRMKEAVELFSDQTLEISKLLHSNSLSKLCQNVHFFSYWHFDYNADDEDQMLRSPACSWYHRYQGIDCKSYTIIASCILTNLNINHFIRKVGYEETGRFTHVYVIVPVDQSVKKWEDLGEYYMIDGTINTSKEIDFIDVRDEFMSGMPHYFLNGRAKRYQLNGGINFAQLSFNSIKNLFASLSCLGGTAYNEAMVNQNVNKYVSWANGMVQQINDAIKNNDYALLASKVQEFDGMTAVIHTASWDKKWWFDGNTCTNKGFDAFIQVAKYFDESVATALYAYINKYWNLTTSSGSKTFTNAGLESQGWVFLESPGDFQTNIAIPNFQLTLKNLVNQIPAFEFSAPLVESAQNGTPVNIPQFLDSLSTIIQVFNPNNGNGTGEEFGGDYTIEDMPTEDNQSKAGFGTFAVVTVGLIAAGWAFFSKDNPTNPKNKTNE